MIQLYKIGNEDYTRNGDATLDPMLSDVSATLNGSWFLKLDHPIDKEGRFDYLKNGVTIKAPTFMPELQLFRVYNTVKNDDSVTVYARPVFLDAANDLFLMDCRPTKKNGQGALDELFAGQNKYSGISDIQTVSTSYFTRKNVVEAIQGSEENSFLNRWGGEILYDNYQISVNFRAGADNGLKVEMGHNCKGLESDIDDSEVVTRIVPVAYNGYTLPGETPWVDSPLISKYPIIKTKEMVFDDIKLTVDASEGEESYNTLEELYEALRKACETQFELGIDKPRANYKCDMIDIAKTDAYKDLKGLEEVSLGDTAHCKNKRIGIETTARVVKVVYDCIRKCNKSVELGDFGYSYFDELASAARRLNSAIDKHGYVYGNKVFGIIDGMLAQLKVQSTAAQKVTRPAYLMEDLDPDSQTYGAMCLGTQGFQIAREQDTDGNWIWTTFGTSKGFVADYIFAGKLLSKNYNEQDGAGFKFDLDTGDLQASNVKMSGEFKNFNAEGIGVKLMEAMLYFLYENQDLGTVTAVPSLKPDGSVIGGILDLWAYGNGEIMLRIGEDKIWSISKDSIPSIPFTGAYTGTVTIGGVNLKFTNGILYKVS